jgi:hypothetical protein
VADVKAMATWLEKELARGSDKLGISRSYLKKVCTVRSLRSQVAAQSEWVDEWMGQRPEELSCEGNR